jgi:hypothetical protein
LIYKEVKMVRSPEANRLSHRLVNAGANFMGRPLMRLAEKGAGLPEVMVNTPIIVLAAIPAGALFLTAAFIGMAENATDKICRRRLK